MKMMKDLGKGLAGILLSGSLFSCSPKGAEVEPIGWYDFNNDGSRDAITLINGGLDGDGMFYPKKLMWLDGNYLKGELGNSYGSGESSQLYFSGNRFNMHSLSEKLIKDNTLKEDPNYPRSARISDVDGDGDLDLELYTQISLEPASRRDVFYDIE